jgi:hypothetical protein
VSLPPSASLAAAVLRFALVAIPVPAGFAAERSRDGLILLLDFAAPPGDVIRDRSGSSLVPDLPGPRSPATAWQDGALAFRSPGGIRSSAPAPKLAEALRRSGEFTLDAWVRTSRPDQDGPARIVMLGRDTDRCAFALVQDGNRYGVRFRTSGTDANGKPVLEAPSGTAADRWTHLAYVRDRAGQTRLYVDGKERASRKVPGTVTWDGQDLLCLGNEPGGKRPWLGQLRLLAVYARALPAAEIASLHEAGKEPLRASAPVPTPPQAPPKSEAASAAPAKPRPAPASAPIPLPGGRQLAEIDFERHVMAVLGRQGCNTGACHGALQGESDLQLSLFSYDPVLDHESLTSPDFGPVADPARPEGSLLLRKPTEQLAHKGGRRLDPGSWQYRILLDWIRAGAPRAAGRGQVADLLVTPAERRFPGPGPTQALRVEAVFQDGSREDVTAFSRFESRDDYVAAVSEDGLVRAIRPGDASIVVSYRDRVASFRALIPKSGGPLAAFLKRFQPASHPAAVNFIDREVFAKLSALGIQPSDLASDDEFLRRVHIDTIGRLPDPDEARAFLADPSRNKREAKIDALLAHPLHAALWATKLSDLTGNNTAALENPPEKRSRMWHDWLRDRVARNVPYDEIVGGILLATSREDRDIGSWIGEARRVDQAAMKGFETGYAARKTLDLFWTRKGLDPELLAEQTAAAFLGVQLQCAQCHKHPYDQWSQADYRAFANAFGQVRFGVSAEAKKAVEAENRERRKIKDKNQRPPDLKEVYLDPAKPKRLKHPVTGADLPPRAPGGPTLDDASDYREALLEWLRHPENPFFARAFVNRVWAHYFGRGIVDPVDNFAAGNPPSHPRLLDALAEDFVSHGFDLRRLEREILRSRAYQLSSVPNASNAADERNHARMIPRPMMAEVVVDVLNSALGVSDEFPKDAPKGSQAIEVASSRVQDGDLSYAFRVFGRPQRAAACDCERPSEPALPQALYLMTDESVLAKIRDGRLKSLLARDETLRSGNASDEQLGTVLDELFLATLTRFPDDAERLAALAGIRRHEDTAAGLRDVLWALINTREFILNH